MDEDLREYRRKVDEVRRKIRVVKAERKELLAYKHSHQGMPAELESLKNRLASLAEEHKKLKVSLSHEERLLESLEKEESDALKIYTSSVEYTTEIFDVFNRGFEKSLEKVKEIQPDFPTHSILPPARALAFKAMLKSNASASLQSDSVPPRDRA